MVRFPALKPGDVFTLPDGLINGPVTLPPRLTGTARKPITIQGGRRTVIYSTEPGKAALFAKAPRHLRLRNLMVSGSAWDGISIAGTDWNEQAEDVIVSRVGVWGVANDGVKIATATDVALLDSEVHGGADQAVDFFGVQGGRIGRNKLFGPGQAAVFAKAGSTDVRVFHNTIEGAVDGIHLGDHGDGTKHRPGSEFEAEDCIAELNRIRVETGRCVVFAGARHCGARANDWATARTFPNGKVAPLFVMTEARRGAQRIASVDCWAEAA